MKKLLTSALTLLIILASFPSAVNAAYSDYTWSDILDIPDIAGVEPFTDKYGVTQTWITVAADSAVVTLLIDAYPMELGSACGAAYEEDGFYYISGDGPEPIYDRVIANDEYGDPYVKAGAKYTLPMPGLYLFDCVDASMCVFVELIGSGGAVGDTGYDENASGAGVQFMDVTADAYYYEPVEWAVRNGITLGTSDTSFSPDTECTRGQILTFLWRAAGCPAHYIGKSPVSDIAIGDYYYDAVLWAYAAGILDAENGLSNPNAPCTRAMTVQFLWLFEGAYYMEDPAPFIDVPVSADYAMAVAWALENGITAGTSDTTFSPDNTCTRGQIVTFLWRTLG